MAENSIESGLLDAPIKAVTSMIDGLIRSAGLEAPTNAIIGSINGILGLISGSSSN